MFRRSLLIATVAVAYTHCRAVCHARRSFVGATAAFVRSRLPTKRFAGSAAARQSLFAVTANDAPVFSKAPVTQLARDWIRRTPLVYSAALTQKLGGRHPVYLKLDLLQASGSFKDRGMAHLCTSKNATKFISSSGGNAGLAVTTVAASSAGPFADTPLAVDVIVPETTKPLVVQKLKELGANVTVQGENWNAADAVARQRASGDDANSAAYVNPFDDPLLWTGHSTLVDEILEDLAAQNIELGALVVSVGGGGLLCGVFEGLQRTEQQNGITVVAAETHGAASFAASWKASTDDTVDLVTLPGIHTIATSLGATCVTPVVIERGRSHVRAGGAVEAAEMDDSDAVRACVDFANDYRMLVEPACGAALALVYNEQLYRRHLAGVPKGKAIVIEVCGGSGVNVNILQQWKETFLDS